MNGFDFQILATTCQITAQSLASFQAATIVRLYFQTCGRSKEPFNFEPYKLRFGEGPQLNGIGKQISLLHGVPNMELNNWKV